MNVIETQMKVGRELVELNANTLRKLAELTGEEQKKLMDMGREFGERMQEVRDVAAFMELQREYAEQLWSGAEEGMKTRGEILREAAEHAGTTLRGAFEQNAEEEVQEAA